MFYTCTLTEHHSENICPNTTFTTGVAGRLTALREEVELFELTAADEGGIPVFPPLAPLAPLAAPAVTV